MIYVHSSTVISPLGLVPPKPGQSDMRFIRGTAPAQAGAEGGGGGGEDGPNLTVQGLPLVKPPYGRITAIDLNKGDLVWQIAHGETPDNIRNHPALQGVNIPRTGRNGRVGTLVTKTLVIAGDPGFTTFPDGRRGAMLRAYDKVTGAGARRGVHAGGANRIADDLHAGRQAISRPCHQRRRLRRRADRASLAVVIVFETGTVPKAGLAIDRSACSLEGGHVRVHDHQSCDYQPRSRDVLPVTQGPDHRSVYERNGGRSYTSSSQRPESPHRSPSSRTMFSACTTARFLV